MPCIFPALKNIITDKVLNGKEALASNPKASGCPEPSTLCLAHSPLRISQLFLTHLWCSFSLPLIPSARNSSSTWFVMYQAAASSEREMLQCSWAHFTSWAHGFKTVLWKVHVSWLQPGTRVFPRWKTHLLTCCFSFTKEKRNLWRLCRKWWALSAARDGPCTDVLPHGYLRDWSHFQECYGGYCASTAMALGDLPATSFSTEHYVTVAYFSGVHTLSSQKALMSFAECIC